MRFFYSFAIIFFSQVLLSQELNQDFINSLPSNIKEDVAKDEAEGIKTSLEEAGAEVELK